MTRSIETYLSSLPHSLLLKLYLKPSNVLGTFRLLSPLAKQVVFNLLYLPSTGSPSRKGKGKEMGGGAAAGVSRAEMGMWMKKGEVGKSLLTTALDSLTHLQILISSPSPFSASDTCYLLAPSFSHSLRLALQGGGGHHSFGSTALDTAPISISFLDKYAQERWERMLHFMVSSDGGQGLGREVLVLLERGEFMVKTGRTTMQITSKGFGFLLNELNVQVWEVVLVYLEGCIERDMDLVEALSCIFMLGSLELGKAYTTSTLSDTMQIMLTDLSAYGLVYIPPSNTSSFYPTRLATSLTSSTTLLPTDEARMQGNGAAGGASAGGSGAGSLVDEESEKGFIILETNYKVYAYTRNALQIALLGLFVHLRSRFANLVVGMITRESIKEALSKGITADQIVAYITANAHPQMRKQTPLLPPTVVDQIRLWELEKNRIQTHEGYLYDDFHTREDFDLVRTYADQLGALVWMNEGQMLLFVDATGNDAVRDFIKRRMN